MTFFFIFTIGLLCQPMIKKHIIPVLLPLLFFSVFLFSQISCTIEEDTIIIIDTVPDPSGNDTIIINNYDTIYCQFPNSILAGQDTGQGIHYVYLNDTLKDANPFGSGTKEKFLDMDGNGSNDLTLKIKKSVSPGSNYTDARVEHWGYAEFITSVSNPTWIQPLNTGDLIGHAANWTVNSLLASKSSTLNGNNINGLFYDTGQKKYIGVKILTPNQVKYGWIGVTVIDYGEKMVIHDYAITKLYCY